MEARLDRGQVQLLTRKRQNWTHRFEPIAQAVSRLPASTALLDGEIVVENRRGVSDFSLLQTDLKDGRSDRFVYYVFDLLHLDGRDFARRAASRPQGGVSRVVERRPAKRLSATPTISTKLDR